MATQGTATAAFATQQAEQSAILSMIQAPLANAWALLNPDDPTSVPAFIQAINALTNVFGRISGHEAATYYSAVRRADGIKGKYTVRPAPPPDLAKVEASVRWALKGLWESSPDPSAARSLVTTVTEKNVIDTGRETIVSASKNDRLAKGWARETEPGCCAFCAMLATRGAVYHYDRGGFQAHDHCRCFAVPVFNAFEPTAQVREWQQLYQESTKGVRGSKAARDAFRQAYEAKYPKAL